MNIKIMTQTKRTKKKPVTRAQQKSTGIISFIKNERVHFVLGALLVFIGIFMLLAMISFFVTGAQDQSIVQNKTYSELTRTKDVDISNWVGVAGAFVAEIFINEWFGIFSLLIPMFVIYLGLRLIKVYYISFLQIVLITTYGLFAGSISSAFILGKIFPNSHINWGGGHGNHLEGILENSIGWPGMVLLILLFVLVAVVWYRKSNMYKIRNKIAQTTSKLQRTEESETSNDSTKEKKPSLLKKIISLLKKKYTKEEIEESDESVESGHIPFEVSKPETVVAANMDKSPNNSASINDDVPVDDDFEVIVAKGEDTVSSNQISSEQREQMKLMEEYDPRKDLSMFKFPLINLLKVYNTKNQEVNMQEQNENKNRIISTLRNYGIEITSIKATVGPTITLYEIVPEAGVRISRIRNLEDDIALSLSAIGIRIIAPMPGKGTVGIEVPNKDPQIVSMQSVISSRKYQESDYELPISIGKTITNEVFVFDLTKMPHLLVAGATGQGKSVGLNAIITSLLYKKHPAELKFVLIDPKMVEFNIYSAIEHHYLAKLPDEEKAIITDVTRVTQTLHSLTKEMDDRYELLSKAHVRNVKEYNEKFKSRKLNPNNGHKFMPYIVVIIDEYGDLIMTAGKEIEMPIARIAQKARAVGIHMVIATQRPTTNIITGTIKANFPARMAFRVTAQVDSRTILDMNGANQLIGRGDMLFSQGSSLTRIQCAFVDTPEVEEITQYIAKQQGYQSAYPLPEVPINEPSGKSSSGIDVNEHDALFEEAARLIVVHQQGSTSLIQRKFSIGYNRAGRLMDQIESAGIVGPAQGSKPREVYISDEYTLEKLLNSLK
ncbi:MAG: DNA translocase FtsK 4TM domain-containing protein [Dysgonamonadaceae bacterium]